MTDDKDTQARYQQMVDRLHSRGYRLTPQRLALLRLLAATTEHPSAAQLYEQLQPQFPTMSLATVYKTLTTLKEIDEVVELGFSQDDNRYDARPEPHPHIICVRCHSIVDTEVVPMAQLARGAAKRSGYRITGSRVEFYGLCPSCQEVLATGTSAD